MELLNETPFSAQLLPACDAAGAECALVVVKATFAMQPLRELSVAHEQAPVELTDEYRGEPGQSSVRCASDVCIAKPGTDLVLSGSVRPPDGARTQRVVFQVGRQRKELQISGPRHWEKVFGFSRISKPERFESMPLAWESAFGGSDDSPSKPSDHEFSLENPVGCGFRAKRSKRPIDGEPLPCLENPREPIAKPADRPAPWCTGFVAPAWEPRRSFAGTFDDAWRRLRAPLLPVDFDPRFHDRAAPDLVARDAPKPGELVRIEGANPAGAYRFALPEAGFEAQMVFKAKTEPLAMHCDTIAADLDTGTLRVTYSAHVRVQGRIHTLLGARILARGGALLA
jgi:hypothetical protein